MKFARPIFSTLLPTSSHRAITYAQAKAFLRLNTDTDQTYVEMLIDAATGYIEGLCGRCLVSRQITAAASGFDVTVRLYGSNVSSLAVSYYNTDNTLTSAGDIYLVDNSHPCGSAIATTSTFPSVYDRPDAVRLVYTTGFGTIDSVPAYLKQAAIFIVADMYENRAYDLSAFKDTSSLIKAADAIISKFSLDYISYE